MKNTLVVLAVLFLLSIVVRDSNAQTFTTLLTFNGTNGAGPCGDLTLSGSTCMGRLSGAVPTAMVRFLAFP